jgi:hypothetical protein
MIASRLVPLFVAVSLVGTGVPAVASASTAKPRPKHSKSKHPTKQHRKTAKKKTAKKADENSGPLHGVVPAAQTAIFGVLKAPPVSDLPTTITRRLGTVSVYEDLGIDGTQARLVGGASTPIYLIPGRRGICLVLNDGGSACVGGAALNQLGQTQVAATTGLTQVAATGLSFDVVDPTTNADGSVNPAGAVKSFGVVPDGIAQVTATTSAGHTFSASVAHNGYVLEADGPIVSRSYASTTAAP